MNHYCLLVFVERFARDQNFCFLPKLFASAIVCGKSQFKVSGKKLVSKATGISMSPMIAIGIKLSSPSTKMTYGNRTLIIDASIPQYDTPIVLRDVGKSSMPCWYLIIAQVDMVN